MFVVSLVSSPGSGKTAFLEKTLRNSNRAIASQPSWAISRRRTMPSDSLAARLL